MTNLTTALGAFTISIKGLKIAASLSEETVAYTATICVDGKPAFHASNHGQGGCDLYHPIKGYTGPSEAALEALCKATLPPTEAYGMTLAPSFEGLIGDLIENEQRQKRLARMLKNKVVVLGEHNGQPALFTIKAEPTPANLATLAARPGMKPIVNGNADLMARALALV